MFPLKNLARKGLSMCAVHCGEARVVKSWSETLHEQSNEIVRIKFNAFQFRLYKITI